MNDADCFQFYTVFKERQNRTLQIQGRDASTVSSLSPLFISCPFSLIDLKSASVGLWFRKFEKVKCTSNISSKLFHPNSDGQFHNAAAWQNWFHVRGFYNLTSCVWTCNASELITTFAVWKKGSFFPPKECSWARASIISEGTHHFCTLLHA